ncbi:MAG TPA: hypothetical protein VFO83_01920, partial [Aggregicoccus sp.]|nr:hypothetical protein [Aggregicoccus sp.]
MSAKRLCAVLVGTMTLVACTPARLAVPEPLAREAAPVKVEKKYRHLLSTRGTLRAGEYVASFDEDGQRNGSLTLGAAQLCRGRRAYRFELASTGREAALKVECEEQMSGQRLVTQVLGGELSMGDAGNRVSCRLEGREGHATFEQAPGGDALSAKRVQGRVAVGAVHLTAESLGREAQGLGPAYLGFQLRREGQVVGL